MVVSLRVLLAPRQYVIYVYSSPTTEHQEKTVSSQKKNVMLAPRLVKSHVRVGSCCVEVVRHCEGHHKLAGMRRPRPNPCHMQGPVGYCGVESCIRHQSLILLVALAEQPGWAKRSFSCLFYVCFLVRTFRTAKDREERSV